MRNLLLFITFLCFLSSCVIGSGRNVSKKESIFGYLGSKPAIGCYCMIIGFTAGLFWPQKKKNKKQKKRRPSYTNGINEYPYKNSSLDLDIQEQEQRSLGLETKLKECEKEKGELKRELDEARRFSEIEIGNSAIYHPREECKEKVYPSESEGVTIVYYLKPSKDGIFKESSKVNKASDALYQLNCKKENSDEATFTFVDSTDNVFGALQNETTWLLPVCERVNLPTSQTKSIRTEVAGKALLKNGEWQIIQKAKISYV